MNSEPKSSSLAQAHWGAGELSRALELAFWGSEALGPSSSLWLLWCRQWWLLGKVSARKCPGSQLVLWSRVNLSLNLILPLRGFRGKVKLPNPSPRSTPAPCKMGASAALPYESVVRSKWETPCEMRSPGTVTWCVNRRALVTAVALTIFSVEYFPLLWFMCEFQSSFLVVLQLQNEE